MLKMLQFSLPFGKWFGVPVKIHWSWALLFLFFLYSSPNFALIYASAFFIVLLHELGHCFAAKAYNLMVRDVILYPFGGIAAMESPARPKQELIVALAGPAVNVALIPVLWLLGDSSIGMLFWLNISWLVFNLLPSFPMDGGRVLRASLALWLNDHSTATIVAGRIGQAFCVLFLVFGFSMPNPILVFVGCLIFGAAEREIWQARDDKYIRDTHQSLTGIKTAPDANLDVQQSARLLAEIQRRLSTTDR